MQRADRFQFMNQISLCGKKEEPISVACVPGQYQTTNLGVCKLMPVVSKKYTKFIKRNMKLVL